MPENYVDFGATTTVASGGYTAGSHILNGTSTASPFPGTATFSVVITDQSTGATKVLLRVTAINSGTQWAVTAEGTDANANAGDNIYAVLSAGSLDQIRIDASQTGTRANLPSTTGQKNGNRYKCTDGPWEFIFNGTAWKPFIFGYAVDEPLFANFSWVNQGGATETTTNGGLILTAPPNSGDSLRVLNQNVLSAPYTCDIAMIASLLNANFTSGGISLSDGTKFCNLIVGSSAAAQISLGANHFTNSTTFSANVTVGQAANVTVSPLIFLRLYDDGTNRNFYYSADGVIFALLASETRTTFLTPTKIGFMVDHNNNTTNTRSSIWVVHFNNYSGAPPTTGYTVS